MTKEIEETKVQDIENANVEEKRFSERITRLNALACNFTQGGKMDLKTAEMESKGALKVLNADGGLQEMLTAQMVSVHNLQQITIAMANKNLGSDVGKYFMSSTIKLANVFAQQANLLSRLQGNGGQKITIERVDVHHGGQAVVGSINGGSHADKVKK
jgi:hypothetical protein